VDLKILTDARGPLRDVLYLIDAAPELGREIADIAVMGRGLRNAYPFTSAAEAGSFCL
jgi:hypothetical protein